MRKKRGSLICTVRVHIQLFGTLTTLTCQNKILQILFSVKRAKNPTKCSSEMAAHAVDLFAWTFFVRPQKPKWHFKPNALLQTWNKYEGMSYLKSPMWPCANPLMEIDLPIITTWILMLPVARGSKIRANGYQNFNWLVIIQ